jgi:hypothetical protein
MEAKKFEFDATMALLGRAEAGIEKVIATAKAPPELSAEEKLVLEQKRMEMLRNERIRDFQEQAAALGFRLAPNGQHKQAQAQAQTPNG